MLVDPRFYLAARIDVAADAVLGGIQGHELHVRSLEEYVNRGIQLAVHPRGVGHQAHTPAFEYGETVLSKNLDADFHPGARADCGQQRRRANQVTETVARQHIITIIKKPT